MRRRELITLLGGTAAWPLSARAQQSEGMRLIGVLSGAREDDAVSQGRLAAFRTALQGLGWIEGRNIRFEVRWYGGNVDRLHAFALDLMKLAPDVISLAGRWMR